MSRLCTGVSLEGGRSGPAGFTEDGLPIGPRIVGRRMDDALVLRASAAFEAAAPWRDRWPPILAETAAP